MKKDQQVVWDVLINHKKIKLQNTLKDLVKTPNVAYQDVLDKFDEVWGVRCLVLSHSNLVMTCKVKPRMGIIY